MNLSKTIKNSARIQILLSYSLLVLLGFLLGHSLIKFNPLLVIVILFLPTAGIVLFSKPEWGVIIILVITSSILDYYRLPFLSFGFGSFHISDLILLSLLGFIIVKRIFNDSAPLIKTPLHLPLILFFVAAVIAFLTASYKYSVPPNIAMRQFRGLAYYSLFFVVTALIHDRNQLKYLFLCILVIGAITSLSIMSSSLLGIEWMGYNVQLEEDPTISRLIPPGFVIMFYAFFIILVLLLMKPSKGEKFFLLPLLILISSGFILSFNRTSWISLTFGSIAVFLIIPFEKKLKLVFTSFAIVLFFIFVSYAFLPQTFFDKYTGATLKRISSMFHGEKTLNLGTLQHRKKELSYAFEKIKKSPLLGIGLSSSYRPSFSDRDGLTWFIHNSYAWILLDMGLVGLVPFLILSFQHLKRGFRNWGKINDRLLSCTYLGITLAYVCTMISSFTGSTHFGDWTVAIFGVTWGINEVIYKNCIDSELSGKLANKMRPDEDTLTRFESSAR